MAKLIRREFVGSRLLFWFQCLTLVGIPLAILHLLEGTVEVEHELEDPEAFLREFRGGRPRSGTR